MDRRTNLEIFIAVPVLKNTPFVLTAYTSLDRSKAACQEFAEELGFNGKLKWTKAKNGSWTCHRDRHLHFSIAPRILDGVSDY
jgi:hypothetical protein